MNVEHMCRCRMANKRSGVCRGGPPRRWRVAAQHSTARRSVQCAVCSTGAGEPVVRQRRVVETRGSRLAGWAGLGWAESGRAGLVFVVGSGKGVDSQAMANKSKTTLERRPADSEKLARAEKKCWQSSLTRVSLLAVASVWYRQYFSPRAPGMQRFGLARCLKMAAGGAPRACVK